MMLTLNSMPNSASDAASRACTVRTASPRMRAASYRLGASQMLRPASACSDTSWRIDCEIDRFPAVIITSMRSPGFSNTLILRHVPTWSTPALVRQSGVEAHGYTISHRYTSQRRKDDFTSRPRRRRRCPWQCAAARPRALLRHDLHVDAERLGAAAAPHAADRRRRVIVAADGEAAVGVRHQPRVRHVDADPARVIAVLGPRVDPGVAGRVAAGFGIDVAGHIARRDAMRVAASQEQVRMVLADALAQR